MSKVELHDSHSIREIASLIMAADTVKNGKVYNFVDQLDMERAVKQLLSTIEPAGYTLYRKDY